MLPGRQTPEGQALRRFALTGQGQEGPEMEASLPAGWMSNPRGAKSQESLGQTASLTRERGATDFQGEQDPEGGFVRMSRFFGNGAPAGERQEGKGRREPVRLLVRKKLWRENPAGASGTKQGHKAWGGASRQEVGKTWRRNVVEQAKLLR